MGKAKKGNVVKIHYTGKLDDGTVFDSSEGDKPLEFTVGAEEVIAGFDKAAEGMEVGEKKTVTIQPEDAYGPHHDELIETINRDRIPEDIHLEVGGQIQATQPDGESIVLTVVDMTDGQVTLDANHPLAGKALTFDVELVEIA
ncbi:peptidylprolyl isomerase [bacterium]|nr:peptidylprolyl isomerase [bacterium]